jgi:transcriptional regulator with XRE-family HTH domain
MTMGPSNTQSRFQFHDAEPVTRLVTSHETESPRNLVQRTDRLLIGKRLRHRRKQRGLTLEAVAERAGLSASAVSLIETGKREAKISTLISLAAALDCELAELLTSVPPSRRAALELRLERAQQSAAYTHVKAGPVRTGPRLPLDALEALVALHQRLAEIEGERDATPEYARRANAALRERMRASDNHFPAIEDLADQLVVGVGHDDGHSAYEGGLHPRDQRPARRGPMSVLHRRTTRLSTGTSGCDLGESAIATRIVFIAE